MIEFILGFALAMAIFIPLPEIEIIYGENVHNE